MIYFVIITKKNTPYESRHEQTRLSTKRKQRRNAVTAQLINVIGFETPLLISSVAAQAELCQTWSETQKTFFLASRFIIQLGQYDSMSDGLGEQLKFRVERSLD